MWQPGVSCTHYFWGGTSWGGGGRRVTHSSHNSTYVLFIIYLLFFIQNISKRINYIMKYLDSYLSRLLVDLVSDGQSKLTL